MNQLDIAKAISNHQFAKVYDSFSDDITWTLVGGKVLEGKTAVVAECQASAEYLSKVATNFTKMHVMEANDTVIIECQAEYTDEQKRVSTVASCDIYHFNGELLVGVTSYNIEIHA